MGQLTIKCSQLSKKSTVEDLMTFVEHFTTQFQKILKSINLNLIKLETLVGLTLFMQDYCQRLFES